MDTSSTVETVAASVVQRESRKLHIFWRALDIIIGGLFIFAGLTKIVHLEHLMADGHLELADPVAFARDIDSYKIVPWTIGVRLAFYLPWLEIVSGLALITRKFYLGGLLILTVLISVFIAATIAVKVRGLDISCSCFGHLSDNLSFSGHLALNFAILGGIIALWFAQRIITRASESRL